MARASTCLAGRCRSDFSSTTEVSEETRWRIVVEYVGTDFVGWQVQPNGRSVQGVLEEALAGLLGHSTHVAGSGRTDSGVHALAQVASFVTTASRDAKAIRDGLCARLPADVACVHAEVVDASFDPRRWTREKTYRYTWLVRRSRSPTWAARSHHVRVPLDVAAMDRAVRCLEGTHDFTAFRAAGCAAAHPNRTLLGASVRGNGELVHLEVRGNGFLRHMVRIIAGTTEQVGRGRHEPAWVQRVLEGQDRSRAGPTAPAQGLTLVEVVYGDGAPPWIRQD